MAIYMALPAPQQRAFNSGSVSPRPEIKRTSVKTEGPVLTREERERFLSAVAQYHRTKDGSEDRILAIRESFNLLARGYRNMRSQHGLTSDDEMFLDSVKRMMSDMLRQVVTCCGESDYSLRQLAFDTLKTLNANVTPQYVYLAKESKEKDIREEAIQALVDQRTRDIAKAGSPNARVKVPWSTRPMSISAYYDSLLVDIATKGSFADSRDKVLTIFAENAKQDGDTSFIRVISEKSMFTDTRTRALQLAKQIEQESVDADAVAVQWMQKLFPNSQDPVVAPKPKLPDVQVPPYTSEEIGRIIEIDPHRRKPGVELPPPNPPSQVYFERVAVPPKKTGGVQPPAYG
ncbi:MAG: hypothetical protein PHU63_00400 [Candidatus ainarchaeum sp.]|nr:hypothetical protein [Candidatus ainarchaeum sp.]